MSTGARRLSVGLLPLLVALLLGILSSTGAPRTHAQAAPNCNTANGISVCLAPSSTSGLVAGSPVTFTATATDSNGARIASFSFNFGDGSAPQTVTPATPAALVTVTATHSFAAAGIYTVSVFATDSAFPVGFTSSTSTAVTIGTQTPGTATQSCNTANNITVCLSAPNGTTGVTGGASSPYVATFTATATDANGAKIANFTFNFGDMSAQVMVSPATPAASASVTITHSFTSTGTFTVSVLAADNAAPVPFAASTSLVVTVSAQSATNVVATLSAAPTTVTPGQPVTFTATATTANPGQTIIDFGFDFGDGTTQQFSAPATGMTATVTVVHSYTTLAGTGTCAVGSSPALCMATVTAHDSSGATGTSPSVTILITQSGQAPTLTIMPSPTAIEVGQTVTFTIDATTTNSGAQIRTATINFGDGTPPVMVTLSVNGGTSTGTVTHTYSTAGSFTVTGTATETTASGGAGLTVTGSTTVRVVVSTIPPPLCASTSATATATPQSLTGTASTTQPPVALLNGPYHTIGTLPITVSAAGSQPQTGQGITDYLFDFGDDPSHTFTVSASPTVTHSYSASNTYSVTVLVVSACQQVSATGVPEVDSSGNPVLMIETASASTVAVVDPAVPNCYPPTGAGPFGASVCGAGISTCPSTGGATCQATTCATPATPATTLPSSTGLLLPPSTVPICTSGACAGSTSAACTTTGTSCASVAAGCTVNTCASVFSIGCSAPATVAGSPTGASCFAATIVSGCVLPPTCGIGPAVGQCSVATPCTGAATLTPCTTSCNTAALSPAFNGPCVQPPPSQAVGINLNPSGPYQGAAGSSLSFTVNIAGTFASSVCTDGSNYGLPGLACTTTTSDAASAGSVTWDFGDGSTASGSTVSHTYAQPGSYQIFVTLSLGGAGTYTAETTATISAAPTQTPAASSTNGAQPSSTPGTGQ